MMICLVVVRAELTHVNEIQREMMIISKQDDIRMKITIDLSICLTRLSVLVV